MGRLVVYRYMLIRYGKYCAEVMCCVIIHVVLEFGIFVLWVFFVFVHYQYSTDTIYCCNLLICSIGMDGYIVVGYLGTYL